MVISFSAYNYLKHLNNCFINYTKRVKCEIIILLKYLQFLIFHRIICFSTQSTYTTHLMETNKCRGDVTVMYAVTTAMTYSIKLLKALFSVCADVIFCELLRMVTVAA